MSDLQQEAVRMISGLSDDNIRFLLEIIHRLIPQDGEKNTFAILSADEDNKMQTFLRLDAARAEIQQHLPEEFLETISNNL